jgi:hypothetical protein
MTGYTRALMHVLESLISIDIVIDIVYDIGGEKAS